MRSHSSLLFRFAAILTTTLVALVTAVAPAQAGGRNDCYEFGADRQSQRIRLCIGTEFIGGEAPYQYLASAEVFFGANATSATRCRLITYAVLTRTHGTTWQTDPRVQDCQIALDQTGFDAGFPILHTGTVADKVAVHACLTLYYGAATSAGWQKCAHPPATYAG